MITKAFITGASSGIGAALARVLAEEGCELILLGRDAAALRSLQEELGKKVGVNVHALDLCEKASLGRACEIATASGADLVINCAGIGFYGRAVDLESKDQEDVIQLNISSLVALTIAACTRWSQQNRRGVVCNISSALGFVPCPFMSVYSASKAFVNNFSQAVDSEMRGYGIRVLTACPGQVATKFRRRAAKLHETLGGSDFFTMEASFVAKMIFNQIKKGIALELIDWKTAALVRLTFFLPKILVEKILFARVPRIVRPDQNKG